MHRRINWIIGVCGILAAILTGCDGGGGVSYEEADVHGRVTFNGEPVPGGIIEFVPVLDAGSEDNPRESSGKIQDDGTFKLKVGLGNHRVSFNLPLSSEDAEEELADAQRGDNAEELAEIEAEIELAKKLAGMGLGGVLVAEPSQVTIASGDNAMDFELVQDDD